MLSSQHQALSRARTEKENAMMNEKWYGMRIIVLLVVALVLATFAVNAKAENPNLKDGGMEVTPWGRCDENNVPLACVMVKRGDKLYLVVHDAKGELRIFIIEDDKPKLIWARDTI